MYLSGFSLFLCEQSTGCNTSGEWKKASKQTKKSYNPHDVINSMLWLSFTLAEIQDVYILMCELCSGVCLEKA